MVKTQGAMIDFFSLFTGSILFLFFAWASGTSIKEKEVKAALRLTLFAIFLSLPFFALVLFDFPGSNTLLLILMGITTLSISLLLIPIQPSGFKNRSIPQHGQDERDTMFSRNDLQTGTEKYIEYYRQNPEKQETDDRFRANPGLLKTGSIFFNQVAFAAAESSFETVEQLHSLVASGKSVDKVPVNPDSLTQFIKSWGKKLGALDTGIAHLSKYHFYSVGGRRERYGNQIDNKHQYAIAFTVEMDFKMMASAPAAPTIMESAQQYLSSAIIAVQAAELIRNLGYSARAHIDANYELICPILARDAGLGDIGRMGLLMTPRNGPRVRISVVTTDLPLHPDDPSHDPSILDFCNRCKKCADVCPAKAISFEKQEEVNGVVRWKLDSDACYTYWTKAGTDCGRCITVCPFSHPHNLFHHLIRKGINNSVLFSKVALQMDHLIYGKKPPPKPIPDWIPEHPSGVS